MREIPVQRGSVCAEMPHDKNLMLDVFYGSL